MKQTSLFILIPLLCLTACSNNCNNFNNDLPKQRFSLSYDFDTETHSANLKCDFDYNNIEIFDGNFNKINNTSLIGGDELDVYYEDNNLKKIDHVIVNKVHILDFVEFTNTDVPGDLTNIEFIKKGRSFIQHNINYAINEDFSISSKRDIKLGSILYGACTDFEDVYGTIRCKLLYVFTFNPRISLLN